MGALLLDGEAVAARGRAEGADRVARLAHEGVRVGLGTVLVGDDGPSERYVAMKHADCAEVGMVSVGEHLPGSATQAEVETATRLLKEFAAHAVTLGGTVETFIEMVFNYPTLAEMFKYAAYDALGHFKKA